jgi:hypothetical protein
MESWAVDVEGSASAGQFSADELSVFKRYLEEDIVTPLGALDALEENLSYYASRHTSGAYFSPAESYHANASYVHSDEASRNLVLYRRAVEWHGASVHPSDSEYVVKREKYVYTDDVPELLGGLVERLNEFPEADFFVVDLLIQVGGEMFQYLPQKNFLFRRTGRTVRAEHFRDHDDAEGWDRFEAGLAAPSDLGAVMPVFTPIRRMLFAGEVGYRLGLQEYGRIAERVRAYLESRVDGLMDVQLFETARANAALGLDGIERSVLGAFLWDNSRRS